MTRPVRFLVDENLSPLTVQFLQRQGFDAIRITDHVKYSRIDEEIAQLSVSEKRILLTTDVDFGEIYHFSSRRTFGIWVMRLSDLTVESVNRRLEAFLRSQVFQKLELSSLVILEDKKERVREYRQSPKRKKVRKHLVK